MFGTQGFAMQVPIPNVSQNSMPVGDPAAPLRMFANKRGKSAPMLTKGQPIPEELLRPGQPEMQGDWRAFSALPLDQQMAKVKGITATAATNAKRFNTLPTNPFVQQQDPYAQAGLNYGGGNRATAPLSLDLYGDAAREDMPVVGGSSDPFAAPTVYATPGIGDGLSGATPMGGASPGTPSPDMAASDGRNRTNWAGILADALSGAAGMPGLYAQGRRQDALAQAQAKAEAARRMEDRRWQVEDRDWKARQPDIFTSGRDRVSYDPATGQSKVLYDGPEDFETYAGALGYKPGTEEYASALQDYVLRSNGPSALDGREEMEGLRQRNRLTLRQTPTYANTHPRPAASGGSGGGSRPPRTTGNVYAPILAKMARGETLTPSEQQVMSLYRRGGGGKAGTGTMATAQAPVATDAKGNKVSWNGTAWVPVR